MLATAKPKLIENTNLLIRSDLKCRNPTSVNLRRQSPKAKNARFRNNCLSTVKAAVRIQGVRFRQCFNALEPAFDRFQRTLASFAFRFGTGLTYADITRRCVLPSRIEETPLRMFSQPFS